MKTNKGYPSYFTYNFDNRKINGYQYFSHKLNYLAFIVNPFNLNPYYTYLYLDKSQIIYKSAIDGLIPFVEIVYPKKDRDAISQYYEKANNDKYNLDEFEKLRKESPFPIFGTFFNLKNVFFFSISKGENLYLNFYYKKSGKLIQCIGHKKIPFKDDIINNLIFFPYTLEDDYLVCVASAKQMKNVSGFESLTDLSNPVLVKIKLKNNYAEN